MEQQDGSRDMLLRRVVSLAVDPSVKQRVVFVTY